MNIEADHDGLSCKNSFTGRGSSGESDEVPMDMAVTVKVKEISIQGFKSFKSKSKIGPLSDFSCIVGPNGAGKSVIGEALGFVFGGSAKNLRTKSLFGLLNEDMRNSKQTSVAKLSFLELKEELSKFGISADITERFIIMQSRHAVKAKHPSELCEYLEVIFGSAHFKELVKEIDMEISEKFIESHSLQEKLLEVQSKIEVLQPEVKKWQSFNSKWHDFQLRKITYLKFQENSLRYKLQQNVAQKDISCAEVCKIKEKRHALQELLISGNSQIADLNDLLVQRRKEVEGVEKHVAEVRKEQLKAKVRLSAAKKDAENEENEYLLVHNQRHAMDNELTSLSKILDNIKEKKETLEQQRKDLEKKKPRLFQSLDGIMDHDPDLISATEDAEDELSQEISKIHEALSDIREEIKNDAIVASKIKEEIHSIEKRCVEMTEEKKKQEEDIAVLQEELQATFSESTKVSTRIVNLKESLKRDELELFKLRKAIENSHNKLSRVSRVDKALEVLRVKLKEKFHGRLIDLAKVEDNMKQAANCVMSHLINTSMTFVTEDRKTADEVIHHFQSQRIGVVTCEILSEAHGFYKQSGDMSDLSQEKSVMEYLQCAHVYKPIFWKYTKNWIILKDRDAAISYFRKKTNAFQRNVVTLKGDIFKHDGEVIAAIKNQINCSLQGCKNPSLQSSMVNNEDELNLVTARQKVCKEELVNYEIKINTLKSKERELQKQLQKLEGSKSDRLSLLSSLLEEKKEMLFIMDTKAKKQHDEEAHLHGVMMDLECSRTHNAIPEMQLWRRNVHVLDEEIKNCESEAQQTQLCMNKLSKKIKKEQSLSVELASKKTVLAELKIRHSQLTLELEQKRIQSNEMTAEVEIISQKIRELNEETYKHKTEITALLREEVKIQKRLENISDSTSELRDRLNKIVHELDKGSEESQVKRIYHDFKFSSEVNQFGGDDEDFEGVTLAEEELSLKRLHSSIDPRTLDEDLNCRKVESRLLTETEKIEELLNSMKLRKEALENERFEIFRVSTRKVNVDLMRIYGELTKHGDAYLSFTEEKKLLFTEGVNFQVRPGRHKWCSFSSLSGGQQSLAALALSFSLQLQFPSPFYFFDEIDAALDTKNAQLVADYVKKQGQAQYIIVSHRPQLYEQATTMVGIYHCCGSSMSITAEL